MQIELPYNFNFRTYQEDVWFDERKNKVLIIHRRAGKTSLALNKLIYEAILNPNRVYWYVAPTYKMAKDIVWTAPNMLKTYLPMAAVEKKNDQELCIYFKNGAQIHLKGADKPESLVGTNPYGIIIDEYAQIKKSLYDEVLLPILLENGGWVWVIGTPRGKNHLFDMYNMASASDKWQALILRASKSGILTDEAMQMAHERMTQKAFEQEMECMFHDEGGVVFRRVKENIEDCLSPAIVDHRYAIGVDLARLQDYTSIDVLDLHTFKIVYRERFNQIDWNLQKARIEAVARRYNNAKLKIDATGVGDPIVEDLKRTGLLVEGIRFNNQIKRDLVENVIILLEQDRIKIPNDQILIDELTAFTCDINERTGTVTYSAPQGLHDDCFVKGTMILTNQGQKPIEKIKVGDLVMTRNGLQPVVATKNSFKKVIKKIGLIGTPNHPIITPTGEKDLQKLKDTDSIYIWNEKLSHIEVKTIIDIQKAKEGSCVFIFGNTINGKSHQFLCIAKNTKMFMVIFLKTLLFTIKTATHLIMRFLIWLLLKKDCIQNSTCLNQKGEKNHLKVLKRILKTSGWVGTNGQGLKKEKHLLKKMFINQSIIQSHKKQFVNIAQKNFCILLKLVGDFVAENAILLIKKKRRVYNLQVANHPEYFANNVLVHNCVMSLCLAVYGESKQATPAPTNRKTIVNIKYDKFGRPSIG